MSLTPKNQARPIKQAIDASVAPNAIPPILEEFKVFVLLTEFTKSLEIDDSTVDEEVLEGVNDIVLVPELDIEVVGVLEDEPLAVDDNELVTVTDGELVAVEDNELLPVTDGGLVAVKDNELLAVQDSELVSENENIMLEELDGKMLEDIVG